MFTLSKDKDKRNDQIFKISLAVSAVVGVILAYLVSPYFWLLAVPGLLFYGLWFGVLVLLCACNALLWAGDIQRNSPEFIAKEKQEAQTRAVEQEKARNIICPHCQKEGFVKTERVTLKKGISGGKATAALVTAGWSVLFTGLSRQAQATKLTCSNCGTTWHVE